MIWIDLEHKLPTDADIPGWTPWTHEQWDRWLTKSRDLRNQLAALDVQGKRKERNDLIDTNSRHWGLLKPWLSALSNGKCWFSEARELYSHYDVEHFRPKAEVKAIDGTLRDGYWWLAFKHTNFRLIGNVGNRKKLVWFPLRAGSLCSTFVEQCEESETRYLLDPIDDDDVSLIAFDDEGKVVAIPTASQWERERVDLTAQTLKLNEHVALCEERRKVWQKVNRLIDDFTSAKARCRGNNPAATAKIREIRYQLRDLVKQTAELSAVARWCLIIRNDHRLTRLIG
ncbi:MAG TPA: hypothetical protein VGF82_06775 [Terracidiphilus sp.]